MPPTFRGLFLLALAAASTVRAGSLDLPPEQFFPLHRDPAFEARVLDVLGPRTGGNPRETWVRMRVSRVWQGGATTTFVARFLLLSNFVAPDPRNLAEAREKQGLIPGRDLLVAVSPLDREGKEFGAVSLGPPDAPAPARPGETMLELFRRLAPAVHAAPVAPNPDPTPAPGASGGTGVLGQ